MTAAADAPVTGAELSTWSDREVWSACARAHRAAWRELVERYDRPLRGVAYNQLAKHVDQLASDFCDDILGAFWLRLVERDMAALRSFDWNRSSGFFNWCATLVIQCAIDYRRTELDRRWQGSPSEDARAVADDGGVLTSGRKRLRGSLSERARRLNDRAARQAKMEERQRRRASRARRRKQQHAR